MELISAALAPSDSPLPGIVLPVERQKLAKRIWRGTATDGMEFGFELSVPLKHGDVFFKSETTRYIIEQIAEPVVEIALEMTPSAAAGIGWAIGNLHLELSAEASRLLAPDEPAVRQLLARLKVPYSPTIAIFSPGRFVRGNLPANELGSSHKH
ncbi:MAG TPA: urease accessory protein UreE [Lacunisphaera sp.]|jgi:urease accessory protein